MQLQSIQNNNYNQAFGARVFIADKDNIIAKNVKKTFFELCKELGKESDEIFITVEKGEKKVGELEKDIFSGTISISNHDYIKTGKTAIADSFVNQTSFTEKIPLWANHEYSVPRNLASIYKYYILPAFEKNPVDNSKIKDAERRLLTAAKSKIME